jgi:hypothetical protein
MMAPTFAENQIPTTSINLIRAKESQFDDHWPLRTGAMSPLMKLKYFFGLQPCQQARIGHQP